MVGIKLLDKTLNIVKERETWALIEDDDKSFTKEENQFLRQVALHLEKDGYLIALGKWQYSISFLGLMEMDKRFLFTYKNKPYQRLKAEAGLQNFGLFVKVFALTLNGLLLLALAVLTFLVKN